MCNASFRYRTPIEHVRRLVIMNRLRPIPKTGERDSHIDTWFEDHAGGLGKIGNLPTADGIMESQLQLFNTQTPTIFKKTKCLN